MNMFDKLFNYNVINEEEIVNLFGEEVEEVKLEMSYDEYVESLINKHKNVLSEVNNISTKIIPEYVIPAQLMPESIQYGSVEHQCDSFTDYNQICYIKGEENQIRYNLRNQGFGASMTYEGAGVYKVITKKFNWPVGSWPPASIV